MNPVPQEVRELVERFRRNQADYKDPSYNETQVRREFIDPLFKALGWDVDNERGYAEAYKDVIHEDAIKVGGATKAPDYCFRIGGARKFFLEAKKPAVPLKDHAESAYQLRRYAWSARLPLSILTDFEELAVYDGRVRPHKNDKSAAARTMYFTYDQYEERWDEIAAIFSRDAVLKGSFDRYAESARRKRGTAEVDLEFLREIECWRETLASNFALRNAGLSVRDLNFAVQRTIDRVIFLRMCEDRGIEQYGQLLGLCNGPTIYPRLGQLFQRADERYNSSLFYFTPEAGREPADELTLGLDLDDKPLRDILRSLYYPESPYEFSVLPPEILGQVYEQFLGKVIRLTKGHRAKIEEKPEVRKAGGVYYTPTYIVDYIVKHTVGKLVEGKTPADIGPDPQPRRRRAARGAGSTRRPRRSSSPPLRILDPACGSGSFLLGAYQYLLDWYRDWYVDDGPEKHTDRVYQGRGGQWYLTIQEKKRILLNNIYGVDIDPQAVEVTKLSLLLKVLEGESAETIGQTLRLFHERALPDLANNIKCGNSLIGPDFYDNQQLDMFDEEQRYRINAFDWPAEFPEVFPTHAFPSRARKEAPTGRRDDNQPLPDGRGSEQTAGFDAVIGNPPYRRELDYKHLMDDIACTAFGRRYRAPRMDLWYYFVHRGLELLRPSGLLSFIVNAYWVAGTGAQKLIAALRSTAHLDEIFFFGKLRVFRGVSGQHMVIRISRSPSSMPTAIKLVQPSSEPSAEPFVTGLATVNTFVKTGNQLFRGSKVDLQQAPDELLTKIGSGTPLVEMGEVRQGIAENPASINRKTNEKHGRRWKVGQGVFALTQDEVRALRIPKEETNLLRPYHALSDLGRYILAPDPSLALIYSTRKTCPDIAAFPTLRRHLARFRPVMDARRETRKGSNRWWHLHWPREERIWRAPKVLSIQMRARPSFVPAAFPVYMSFSVNVFVPSPSTREGLNYFAGVLNSRLLWKWYQHHAKRRGAGLEINGNVLARTPLRPIDFSDPADTARHDRMVSLVQQMLDLHKELSATRTPTAKTAIQRQIDATDRQIDRLVYDLYGLTEDEIRIVEEATSHNR